MERAIDFQAPQFVTVVGNHGTGKTRLVSECRSLIGDTARVFWGRAIEGGARYSAVNELLRDRFGWAEDKSGANVIEELRPEISELFGDKRVSEILYVLGSFLGVDYSASPFLRVLQESPSKYDAIARTVLCRFFEIDAAASPLVLVFDDLHWMDEDTMLLLKELGSGLGGSPVVVIACARPELLVRWGDWGGEVADYVRVDLGNLEPEDAERLLRNLFADCQGVSAEAIDQAVEMTGGNPHLIHQLIDMYEKNGTIAVRNDVRYFDALRASQTTLSITVEEAIQTRIADLEMAERRVLEAGAVFGNVFWLGAVCAFHRLESAVAQGGSEDGGNTVWYRWTKQEETIRRNIEEAVEELVERDYLLRLGPADSTIAGDVELVFKHNLERELILKSMERNRQVDYHRYAAQWLELNLEKHSEEQMELLAVLQERGALRQSAAHSYIGAGDRARERFANDEAIEFYRRAMRLLEAGDAPERLQILQNMGDILYARGRTEDARVQYGQMLRHAWLFDNQVRAGVAHVGLARTARTVGSYELAMQHLREANALFRRCQSTHGVAQTLDDIGSIHRVQGEYNAALEFHRQALSLRRALKDKGGVALSLAHIGGVCYDRGEFPEALKRIREALHLHRDIDDLLGTVASLCDYAKMFHDGGSSERALQLLREAHQLAVKAGDRHGEARTLSRMGECHGALGRKERAIECLREAAELAKGLGSRVLVSECCQRLASVYMEMGDARSAQEYGALALSVGESIGSKVHVGAAHRVLAEVLLLESGERAANHAQVKGHFVQAVSALTSVENPLELGRCFRSFAKFHERAGDAQESSRLMQQASEVFDALHTAMPVD